MLGFSETARKLKVETSILVDAFRRRARQIRGSRELTALIKPLDRETAVRTACEYFGEGEYLAAGIDGSMQTDELLEMFIFYINAAAYSCPFTVSKGRVEFHLDRAERNDKLSVSAAVPLWMEDLPEAADSSVETDYQVEAASSRISFAIMTMAELKMACEAVGTGQVKILLLDRPLSGTFPPLARDYRDLLRMKKFSLNNMPTPAGTLSLLDMTLAYYLGSGDNPLPPRERLMPYAVVRMLLDGETHSATEIGGKLGLSVNGFEKTVKRLRRINADSNGLLLEKGGGKGEDRFQITDYARGYWRRVEHALDWVLEKVFKGVEHPLAFGEDRWLTARDLNVFNTLIVYRLRSLAHENKALVIGVAKDVGATDLSRVVMPFAASVGMLDPGRIPRGVKSDRALLGLLSTSEEIDFPTPWRTLGYDAVFTTLVFREEGEPSLSAARKRAGLEGFFVRSYFQLRSMETDYRSKSSVFLYDRFQNEVFDGEHRMTVKISEMNRACDANVYFEGKSRNRLDELILLVLSLSDNPHVAEAFGHNQLLFLADKAVKAEAKQARPMLRGVVELEIGPLARTDRMFNIARRFRDIRAEYEGMREAGGGEE
ncbi:MAG: DNA double-strand break repair nuclease NurA [Candidatus Brockarchaeota archaeon]|nr:DNA double-strand break repair nuclease NurA [Candidatus Brockarchaeota archaeon]